MKKSLIFSLCLILLTINQTTNKAYGAVEKGVAGISVTLEEITPTYLWTTTRVNLRSEASTDSDIIITLDKRVKVQKISSSDSKWTKVLHNNRVGYINEKYLRDTELPSLDFKDEDIDMLQRIVEAECTGCSIDSKENVANVIINRILDLDFPDDMESIIFQDGQFSPISDGRYFTVDITEDTIEAVNNVLNDGSKHKGIFFCNMKDVKSLSKKKWFKSLEFLFEDDSGHSYYSDKKVGGEN